MKNRVAAMRAMVYIIRLNETIYDAWYIALNGFDL